MAALLTLNTPLGLIRTFSLIFWLPPSGVGFTSPEHTTEYNSSFRIQCADPGCLSRILIFIYPGSPDPTRAPKEEGGKFVCPVEEIFFSQNTKNNRYFLPKKLLLRYQKIQNYGFRIQDAGSGKNLLLIPDQKGTGSQIRNTARIP